MGLFYCFSSDSLVQLKSISRPCTFLLHCPVSSIFVFHFRVFHRFSMFLQGNAKPRVIFFFSTFHCPCLTFLNAKTCSPWWILIGPIHIEHVFMLKNIWIPLRCFVWMHVSFMGIIKGNWEFISQKLRRLFLRIASKKLATVSFRHFPPSEFVGYISLFFFLLFLSEFRVCISQFSFFYFFVLFLPQNEK